CSATNEAREIKALRCAGVASALLHVEEFHVEYERRVRRNRTAGAARAVSELRRDHERPLAADFHASNALIPALDHLSRAEPELERIVAVAGAVEFLSVLVGLVRVVQPARVVDDDVLAGLGLGARSDLAIGDLQARDVVHKPSIVVHTTRT